MNVDLFTGPAKKCGVNATLYTYKPAADTAQAAATAETAMQTLVPKMKNDGITTVIMFSGANAAQTAITEEATKQEYSPEWLVTGVGYSDIDVTARMRNQEQWAHAFGIAGLIPAVASDSSTPSTTTYQWYWGTSNGTIGVWPWGLVENLAFGLHNAGPKLTPETFRDGMFGLPAQGGAATDQITTVQMRDGRSGEAAVRPLHVGRRLRARLVGPRGHRRIERRRGRRAGQIRVARRWKALPGRSAPQGRTDVLQHGRRDRLTRYPSRE